MTTRFILKPSDYSLSIPMSMYVCKLAWTSPLSTTRYRNLTQWIESLPSVWEVMGSIPVGTQIFFIVPRSCHIDQFTFHISLPSSKFAIFIHISRSNEIRCSRGLHDNCENGGFQTSSLHVACAFSSVLLWADETLKKTGSCTDFSTHWWKPPRSSSERLTGLVYKVIYKR